MAVLTVSKLAADLRALADAAEHRLWIASPYIGSWTTAKRILGSAWQKVDARLLTDKDSGILARDTIEVFAAHRPVRSLRGLHAKLYIVDDCVLLTSANLTQCAFTRRHEAGLIIEGQQAQELIDLYQSLWECADEIPLEKIPFTVSKKGLIDELHHGEVLPKLYELPPSPAGLLRSAGDFADYPYFLDEYRHFAKAYVSCGGREHPEQPLYLEMDGFLDFLFHHDDRPSHEYTTRPYRHLSDSERMSQIKKYRERYRRARPGGTHTMTAKLVQNTWERRE